MSSIVRRMIVAVLVVAGVASYWTADLGQTVGSRPLPKADRVVLFGIPRLGLGDLTAEKMPNLMRLGDQGAIGSLRVKTDGPRPNVAEAYASIGAGSATHTGAGGMSVYGADAAYLGSTALAAQRLATGLDRDADVVIPGAAQMVAQGAPIGTLSTLLEADGRRIGVVSNADTTDQDGQRSVAAPAALVASDDHGFVKPGDTSANLLRRVRRAPYGVEVDPSRFVDSVLGMLADTDVVVADPGETLRAESYLSLQTRVEGVVSRRRSLARTDALVGQLARKVPKGTRIIVFGVTPGAKRWALTPIVVAGAGVVPGRIGSPSTHRTGMATLTDITPTVLASLGMRVPDSLGGSALRETPGRVSWEYNRRYDRMFATHSTTTTVTMVSAIVVQAALFVAALVFCGLGRPGRRLAGFFRFASVTFASWPLATLLLRVSVTLSGLWYGSLVLTWLLAVALAAVSLRLAGDPIRALRGIALATLGVIVTDLATGTRLLFGSFFGYTPDTSSRYFGINNSVFAILAACAVVVATFATERERERGGRDRGSRSVWVAAVVFAVTVFADGAPWLGADVGGILTLVPVFGLTLWALAGRRVRWHYIVGAALAGVAVLALVVGVDLVRDPDQRTHIGRFFLGVGSGGDKAFPSMVAEKWRANTAVLAHSIWAWAIPISAVYGLYVLVVAGGWQRRLPPGSAVRVGTISALCVGVVGWLLNDSGVVVTALVYVFLGPMLILVTLRDIEARGEPPRTPQLKEVPAP